MPSCVTPSGVSRLLSQLYSGGGARSPISLFVFREFVQKMHAGRSREAGAILGSELAKKLSEVKVLLVGAGGIGCEVCECLLRSLGPLLHCRQIETVDLTLIYFYSEEHCLDWLWSYHTARPRYY
jgi:hypothetical protein